MSKLLLVTDSTIITKQGLSFVL